MKHGINIVECRPPDREISKYTTAGAEETNKFVPMATVQLQQRG
jgi:hypothetical protein